MSFESRALGMPEVDQQSDSRSSELRVIPVVEATRDSALRAYAYLDAIIDCIILVPMTSCIEQRSGGASCGTLGNHRISCCCGLIVIACTTVI